MGSKTVYFRIGSDKAGTVALASLVNDYQLAFARKGVFWPFRNAIGLVDHIIKTNELAAIDWFDPSDLHAKNPIAKCMLAGILSDDDWRQLPKTVLTTEVIWGRLTRRPIGDEHTRSQIARLFEGFQDFFAGYDFKIILHLRRADRYYESLWNQHVKGGGKLSLAQFKTKLEKQEMPAHSLVLIDLLEASFGRENIIIKPFERGQMHEGDLISDFLKTIDCDVTLDDNAREAANESLHTALLEVLHEVNNSKGKVMENSGLRSLSGFIKENCDVPESKILLDDEQRAEVLDSFAEFYATLSERYNDNKPLFLEPVPKMKQSPPSLTDDDKELVRTLLFAVKDDGFSSEVLEDTLAEFKGEPLRRQAT